MRHFLNGAAKTVAAGGSMVEAEVSVMAGKAVAVRAAGMEEAASITGMEVLKMMAVTEAAA
jgi:hypothetical protein